MSGRTESRAEDSLTSSFLAPEAGLGGGEEEGVLLTKNGKKYKKLCVSLELKNGGAGRHVAPRPLLARHGITGIFAAACKQCAGSGSAIFISDPDPQILSILRQECNNSKYFFNFSFMRLARDHPYSSLERFSK